MEDNIICPIYTEHIEQVAGKKNNEAIMKHEDAQKGLRKVEVKVKGLTAFHQELSMYWTTKNSWILGHVIFSLSIAASSGIKQYTQDVAVIKVDASKIDPSSFVGNIVDLSTILPEMLISIMYANPRNSHNFNYPCDHLLSLQGTIPDDELCNPTMYDQDNNPCIMAIKCGRATSLTVSHAKLCPTLVTPSVTTTRFPKSGLFCLFCNGSHELWKRRDVISVDKDPYSRHP